MQKIRDINDDIHKLAQGARQSATNRKTASKKELCVVQNYCKRVRDSAQSICNSLRSVILHDCGDHEHGISLCLEMRDAAGRVLPNLKACSSTLRFRIVFSLAESKSGPKNSSTHPVSGWKELEVEPIVSEGDMDIDENKPLLDVICGDGSIPAIHLNNLDINSQGELSRTMRPIEAASRNTDLMQPTSNINTCTLRQERPTTPTKQVRFGL